MACVYPATLPHEILNEPRRSAEKRVFEALRDALPDRYCVFYSFAWVAKRTGGRALDGEADFVIAHPDRGVLVVEVKGGRVAHDGIQQRWTTTDRDGVAHEIDPVAQVRHAKFALIEKLTHTPGWGDRWIDIGHSVIFPHCVVPNGPLTTDLPRALIIDGKDLENVAKKIEAIYDYWAPEARGEPLGDTGIAAITRMLAPSFELKQPMALSFKEEDRQILRLTQEQFNLIEFLRWNRRVAISGGAGTGKTLLALEKARRLAESGSKTLLVCFNRPLADFLHTSAAGSANLTALSFHQLCARYSDRQAFQMSDTSDPLSQRRFEQELPMCLIDAIADDPTIQFDAIVVDEGQDFLDNWWHALEWALREGSDGTLYVFYDDNQRLYRSPLKLPKGLIPTHLTTNLRNTRYIFGAAKTFYSGPEYRCGGPEGRPPEFIVAATATERERAVSKALDRMIRQEGVAPSDIALLCGKRLAATIFADATRIGAYRLSHDTSQPSDAVLLETVYRFKGLERPVIVLTEIDDLVDNDDVLYVGLTRARLHLMIVATATTIERLRVTGSSTVQRA